jgi:hypothetical protein
MTKSYKEQISLEQRIEESNRILSKHPYHIPVIVDVDKKVGTIKKNKFLVPSDVLASHLMVSIRSQIKCNSSQALFMFNENTIICPTMMMGDIYRKYINKQSSKSDKFFYITVHGENTFG